MKHCPFCKQAMSEEVAKDYFERRSAAVKKGVEKARKLGVKPGRGKGSHRPPKKYEEIMALRSIGYGIRRISEQLKIAPGTVKRAFNYKFEITERDL